ncbi:MAG TPA: error-prone DNA polymerase [Burkholderiaceae bacterium]|nr:error-prone DNA polymerase [Burkholderiaceae bacterium]
MQIPYVELHCLSNFSFLRGASHPEELVERALALGYSGLALTDECSFAGSVRAHLALQQARANHPDAASFQLIHGTEIQLADGPRVVLLAQSRRGYGNLSELVTLARRAASKAHYRMDCSTLEANAHLLDDTLALLIPGSSPTTGQKTSPGTLDAARTGQQALWLKALFAERAWIACALVHGPDDAQQLAQLQTVARSCGMALVATGEVHMHIRGRKKLQDALTAVHNKTPLSQCGARLSPNAERYLRPRARLMRTYPAELLLQTREIAQRCSFSLEELRYEYPDEIVPAGETPASYLRRVTLEGAVQRYPAGVPEKVQLLLEHELRLIAELRYEPYFLTVYDIVRFARSRAILCQGRGSAANSAVCYCLGITEVDPERMSVLFERFISRERNEPPDIDVDFEHQRREEVMQYLFTKYGRERAALTAALHTYRPRGALRDLGKALGLSLDQVDKLAKTVAWWDGRRIEPSQLLAAGFDPENPVIAQLIDLAHQLIGFPRHLSQHSGGFVIARDKLSRMVPIENAAMAERTVIQWDKDDLDALGLLKIDVLALGMLSCLRRAIDHVNAFEAGAAAANPATSGDAPVAAPQRAAPMTLADIPAEDPRVYEMLARGDSLGVFQVESRAQMNMLPRLRPQCFYDLVIETAIVRPGPIQGGMVHPYLRRRQGLEPVTYPSESVRAVLERTLGVSIFQEQVMQLAVVAAGFTPGEADRLRRAMAAWKRKGGIGPFRDRLIAGMLARGYSASYAEQIVRQIQGFGEYGFPESHAASFALLVYVSAWLKCHRPAAFCAALLDSQPLGFYAPAQIVRDAIDHGVTVRPVCVTASNWYCTLESCASDRTTPAVRLGLALVQGLTQESAQRVLAARAQSDFSSVQDLVRRAQLSRGELARLAAADALAALSGHRRNALWSALGIDVQGPRKAPLAAEAPAHEKAPELIAPTEGQDIVADYRTTGLSLRRHPLALLRPRLQSLGLCSAREVARSRHRQLIRTGGIVTCRQRPATASGVTFITLEDETGCINIVVWRTVAERFRKELLGACLLVVYGHLERVDTNGNAVVHVIADRLVDRSTLLGGLTVNSRDFH